ncbi:MAG: PAS domain S-box protein [Smithella sp.]
MGKDNAFEIENQPSLRILVSENSEDDILRVMRELKKGGYHPVYERVETAAAMKKALLDKQWDIIICDYNLPKLKAPLVIALLRETNTNVPLIIISGINGEETAVECMRLGVQDYIMKSDFSRLCPAVARQLEEAKTRNKQRQENSQSEAALEALRQSEEKHRTILGNIEEGYYEIDLNGNFIYFNDSMSRILGYHREELIGMNSRQCTDEENAKKLFKTFHEVYKTGKSAKGFDWQIIRKNGTERYIEASVSLQKDASGKPKYFSGIVRDITERKRVESQREAALEALRKSEELYTKLVAAIPDVIIRTDLEGNILFANDNTLKLGGYRREEIEGQSMIKFIVPEDRKDAIKNLMLIMKKKIKPREYKLLIKDGGAIPFEVNGDVLRNKDGTPFGAVHVGRDISERKRIEKIMRENEERLRGITKNLPGIIFQFYAKDNGAYGISYASERLTEFLGAGANTDNLFSLFLSQIHEEDRDRFLASMKTAVEEGTSWNFEGRFSVITTGEMIWFQGLATPSRDEDQMVFNGILLNITERKLAEEKFHKIFMTTPDCIAITRMKDGLLMDVNNGFEEITGWPRSKALGKTSYEINFWNDTADRAFMINELRSGRDILHREFEFRRSDGSVRAGIYSARSIKIDGEACLIFILQDVTEHKRMDAELQRTLDSLRKAFGTTIQVMISAIEMRDPYTAGHQKRCADIARAIATEMGFAQERIDGIRMVGTIHDIGKLSVPAEILTKPTKLTKIEFSLIKEHSRSGYDMLKNIESPWPLAEIIYQHHERMNGTGYPRKLKGDEILMEARIMAVADVVEAMSAHRPYRAALGIEAALTEIEKNRGILYDDAVVDACLRLFGDKGYKLP